MDLQRSLDRAGEARRERLISDAGALLLNRYGWQDAIRIASPRLKPRALSNRRIT